MRRPRSTWPTSTRRPIGAGFDGNGTFEFGEPRRFEITNRSTGRARAGHVPMTGTIHAVDRRRRLSLRPQPPLARVSISRAAWPAASIAATALLSHHERAGARARQRRGGRRQQRRDAGLSGPRDHAGEVHGALDVPMTLGRLVPLTARSKRTIAGDAVDVPLLGRVRAAASVVADTRRADITASTFASGTAVDHRRCRSRTSPIGRGPAASRSMRRHAEELQANVPEAWRVAGPLRVDAVLGGTFDAYTLDTTITGVVADVGGPVDRSRHREGDRHAPTPST